MIETVFYGFLVVVWCCVGIARYGSPEHRDNVDMIVLTIVATLLSLRLLYLVAKGIGLAPLV